ncbi:efflux RND transporter periplasmic adaptor subunit [Spirochaeta africana]|uniref:RND family efflux transporter, MFP subunit n=1 Tax=Spirochaeta africana (strain ATCC 700263 / DSM 8902 / Z-7692) TaxID=889378 RepID=H9UM72_SPIAZ|nr:efflux RND transporter periplasmic adaptor subunit [Spirochaeta africana]AFG38615.1 RND family efflux transporter, MFP subunit [Spirochaeta africana DSM 8902]
MKISKTYVRVVATIAAVVLVTAGCSVVGNNATEADAGQSGVAADSRTGGDAATTGNRDSDISVAVRGYEAAAGSLADAIPVSGTVAGIREATVVTETQGVIQEVLFELGERVEAGSALVRFDDRAEAAGLRQAEQQLSAARLDYESAQRRFERGSASQAELTQARAAAAGAESAREQARRAYENRTVRAPFSGHIADAGSEIQVGNLLSPGSRVVRIVDTSRLRMRVGVGERSVGRIQSGNPVQVFVSSFRNEAFPGVVRSVGAGADPLSGSFPVIIEWKNPPAFQGRSGLSGNASIAAADAETVIIAPAAAVTSRQGRTVVFVAVDGVAREREVRLAGRRGPRAAVVEGLQPGDVVISSGVSSLEDGSLVTVSIVGISTDIQ